MIAIAGYINAFITVGVAVKRAVEDAEAQIPEKGQGAYKKIIVLELLEEVITALGVDATLSAQLKSYADRVIERLISKINSGK